MNKNQFISFIENPDKLSGADGVLLAELIKNFPYFQTAHLLYAKSLHNENSIHYNNQLKITAAYASDRKVLHRLITKQGAREAEIVLTPKNFIDIEEEKIEESVINIIKEEVLEHNIKPIVEEIKVEETRVEVVEVPAIVEIEEKLIEKIEEKIREEKQVEEEEKVAEVRDEVLENFEKEVLAEAVNGSYEVEILNLEPLLQKSEPIVIEEKVEIEEPIINKKEVVVVDADSLSFTDWLKHLNNGDVIVEKEKEEAPTPSEDKPLGAFDLIDKFIKEEPRLTRPKVEFYNPVNMAKQSVADDINFVSETLAKIYVLQGNYIKALHAYENLHLKYPEKRLYFAAQIKNIRKLINQQKQQ